ncbi:MAG: AAA family ATPase [Angustibacter sp.]
MITAIECSGYRTYLYPTRVSLRRLNVLFGRNNSGKTTLLRLPAFACESLRDENLLALSTSETRFGASFRDIASAGSGHPDLEFAIHTDRESFARVHLQEVSSLYHEEVVLSDFDSHLESFQRPVLQGMGSFSKSERERIHSVSRSVAEDVGEIVHVTSNHRSVRPNYETRDPDVHVASDSPYLFQSSRELRAAVRDWFEAHLGVALDVDASRYTFSLTGDDGRGEVNFANMGRGTQAAFFVVVPFLAARLGLSQPGLMIVEEPEAHLHPAAHASLAHLMLTAPTSVQVVTETHSETFILRLRRLIGEGVLDRGELSLLYFEGGSPPREVGLDKNGAVEWWPSGVFEEDVEEARKLLEIRLAR